MDVASIPSDCTERLTLDDGDGGGDSDDDVGDGDSGNTKITLTDSLFDEHLNTVPFIQSSVSHTTVTAMVLVTLSLSVTVALQRYDWFAPINPNCCLSPPSPLM